MYTAVVIIFWGLSLTYGASIQNTLLYPVLGNIVINYNPQWVTVPYLKVTKVGTSDVSLNGNLTVLKIPEDTQVTLILKRKTAEDYQIVGQKLHHQLCDFIKTDKIFYQDLLKYGNFPKECPVQPKEYHVTNYKIGLGNLANVIPPGEYKVDIIISSGEDLGYAVTVYVSAVQTLLKGFGRTERNKELPDVIIRKM